MPHDPPTDRLDRMAPSPDQLPAAFHPLRDVLLGYRGDLPPADKRRLFDEALTWGESDLEIRLSHLNSRGMTPAGAIESIAVVAFARCLRALCLDIDLAGDATVAAAPPIIDARKTLLDIFGFVPKLFEAQAACPTLVCAEAQTLHSLLACRGALTRAQREELLFMQAVAHRNAAGAALHGEVLVNLGYDEGRLEQLARLGSTLPAEVFEEAPAATERRALSAWAEYESVCQRGLTPPADVNFEFIEQILNPVAAEPRRTCEPERSTVIDEDSALVQQVQAGDMAAFGQLITRHGQTVWRSIVGLTGRADDAEDHVQNAFIKAYEHIAEFRGDARFSTWLTRIAINEALQVLRRDRRLESVDPALEPAFEEAGLRPRPAQRWCDDPESIYSRAECLALVERELAALPAVYRLPVVLRDMQGLSGEETAELLGLPLATMKTRLLRGRAMLRVALTPYFARPRERLDA